MSLVANRIFDRAYSSNARNVDTDGSSSIMSDRPLPPPAPPTVLTPPPPPLSTDRGPTAPYEPFLANKPPPQDSYIAVDTKPTEYRLIVRLPGFRRDAIAHPSPRPSGGANEWIFNLYSSIFGPLANHHYAVGAPVPLFLWPATTPPAAAAADERVQQAISNSGSLSVASSLFTRRSPDLAYIPLVSTFSFELIVSFVGIRTRRVDAPHKSPPAVFAFCAQDSATSATLPGSREDTGWPKACEVLRRPPRPQAAVSGCPGTRGAVPSLGALAERGTGLRSLERWARKRSRALRAVAAWFRIVSVRPNNPDSCSPTFSISICVCVCVCVASCVPSALRIAFHCVCDYCEVLANTVANSANSANQARASIASCEARADREAS
ncbi:hypothetical protein NUW54_g2393 [Trametes sanguinea]|uniref:Uncharacterized protein n=1 Tax=Trametes sanguinea TaxID=158606 RepID=A0ACC1Q518_9APHY|nr:hypothetical protein NUW54_g2393 [Trametes sanguinea]